jgi:hypothetical protein
MQMSQSAGGRVADHYGGYSRTGPGPEPITQRVPLLMAAPAGLAGAAFLAYRHDNAYSLLMAAGFLGALFAYWAGLFLAREPVRAGTGARARR